MPHPLTCVLSADVNPMVSQEWWIPGPHFYFWFLWWPWICKWAPVITCALMSMLMTRSHHANHFKICICRNEYVKHAEGLQAGECFQDAHKYASHPELIMQHLWICKSLLPQILLANKYGNGFNISAIMYQGSSWICKSPSMSPTLITNEYVNDIDIKEEAPLLVTWSFPCNVLMHMQITFPSRTTYSCICKLFPSLAFPSC